MEDFERAVRSSHGQCSDDNTTSRHRQFIAAIENQISHVEESLRGSFNEEGNQPLQWVNLDQEEQDDLAMFLSGTSRTLQNAKDEHVELGHSMKSSPRETHYQRKETDFNISATCNINMPVKMNGFNDVVAINKDATYIIELEAKEVPEMRDDVNQTARTANTRGAGNSQPGSWKIVIADEDKHSKKLVPSIEAAPKGKQYKALFWKQKCGEHPQAKRGINWLNQV